MKHSEKSPKELMDGVPQIPTNKTVELKMDNIANNNKRGKRKISKNPTAESTAVNNSSNDNNVSANALYNYIINGFAFNKTAY